MGLWATLREASLEPEDGLCNDCELRPWTTRHSWEGPLGGRFVDGVLADFVCENCRFVRRYWGSTSVREYCNKERARVRRARVKGVEGNFTEDEWRDLLVAYGGECAAAFLGGCSGRMERSHIIPLARPEAGPTNHIENIYPLCQKHNGKSGQGSRLLAEWLGPEDAERVLRFRRSV